MTTRYYWWIVSHDPDTGRPYLIFGSDKSEENCRQHGLEILGNVDFEIKRYPTRDISRASSLYRGSRLDTTHSLKEASRRIGHDKSIKRLRSKQSQGDRIW
jgi:hypothetical protein